MNAPYLLLETDRERLLAEREEALNEALERSDWWESRRTRAKLACGCEGLIVSECDEGESYKVWKWTTVCEAHQ